MFPDFSNARTIHDTHSEKRNLFRTGLTQQHRGSVNDTEVIWIPAAKARPWTKRLPFPASRNQGQTAQHHRYGDDIAADFWEDTESHPGFNGRQTWNILNGIIDEISLLVDSPTQEEAIHRSIGDPPTKFVSTGIGNKR